MKRDVMLSCDYKECPKKGSIMRCYTGSFINCEDYIFHHIQQGENMWRYEFEDKLNPRNKIAPKKTLDVHTQFAVSLGMLEVGRIERRER